MKAKKNFSKHNSMMYGIHGVKVSKHALARFMQRLHILSPEAALSKILEYFRKSVLIEVMDDGYEKRCYKQENIVFICRKYIEKQKNMIVIVTMLIGRIKQLEKYSSNVYNIDYDAFDGKIKEYDYDKMLIEE